MGEYWLPCGTRMLQIRWKDEYESKGEYNLHSVAYDVIREKYPLALADFLSAKMIRNAPDMIDKACQTDICKCPSIKSKKT